MKMLQKSVFFTQKWPKAHFLPPFLKSIGPIPERYTLYINKKRLYFWPFGHTTNLGGICMNKSYYELFEEYLRQCPWAESMVVNWEPKGDMKILVELNDGSWMTYDGVYKILRSSHDKSRLYDTPSDYEEWRHISGRRLDRWLTMHDVSRSAVTDTLDVSQPTLVRYLNGDRPLPAYIVYLIAKHFCMSAKDLSYILCVTDE